MVTKHPLLTAAPHALVSRSETDAPDGEYKLKGTCADTADSHDMSTVSDVPAKFLAAGYGWEAKQLKIKCYFITRMRDWRWARTLTQPKSSAVASKRPLLDLWNVLNFNQR